MKKKLSLKKITTSNLSEDFARQVFGGDSEEPTYNNGETQCSCACSDPAITCEPKPTQPTGCGETCESVGGPCTNDNCPATDGDMSCANGPATCVC
ncbi:MAG: hypothetical protein J7621_19055 [Niastella sp.]|nr:hypothetical protein [Niastella sp.]